MVIQMQSKQILGIVIVLVTVTVGLTVAYFSTIPPVDDTNNETQTTIPTTTTTTDGGDDGGNTPILILRDMDLLEYNITLPETLWIMTDGNDIYPSDLQGKWTIIDFMATWCPPCKIQNVFLKQIHDAYGDSINLISLTVTISETLEMLEDYADENNITWRTGQDYGEDWDNTMADFLGIRYIPTPIIIDPNGVLRWMHEGTWIFQAMNDTLTTLMG
jgi:thiol-disulfide isomerase/thioredoxin